MFIFILIHPELCHIDWCSYVQSFDGPSMFGFSVSLDCCLINVQFFSHVLTFVTDRYVFFSSLFYSQMHIFFFVVFRDGSKNMSKSMLMLPCLFSFSSFLIQQKKMQRTTGGVRCIRKGTKRGGRHKVTEEGQNKNSFGWSD